MKKRKKFLPHLLISLLSFIGLILIIITFQPKDIFDFFVINIPIVIVFFFLVLLSFGGLFIFIFKNLHRGILIALFLICFLLMQFARVNNIFFTLILAAIIILLELFFMKRK